METVFSHAAHFSARGVRNFIRKSVRDYFTVYTMLIDGLKDSILVSDPPNMQ